MSDQLERARKGEAGSGDGVVAGLLVFCVALAVRLYFLYDISDNPSFAYPLVDASSHNLLARELQRSNTIPVDLFWRSVFYPLFLGATYATTGSSILAAKLLHALLGATTCLLTQQLGRRAFGPACGLIAGLVTAFYGPLLFWESELVAVAWAAFWSVLLVHLALRAKEVATPRSLLVFGLIGGIATLTRPSFLPFVLLTMLWLAWSGPARTPGRVASRLSFAAVGFLVLTIPTALTSAVVANHLSFLPRAGTLNLYLGNHPDRCEALLIRPGQQWLELGNLLAKESASAADGPSVFRDHAVENALRDPASFAAGLAHKLGQLAGGREIPRNVDIYLFRQWSPMLSLLVFKVGNFGFPFGLLFPLAAVGLALHWRRVPTPLLLLVLSYPLVIAATFVAGRYRAPLVPALAILAAAGGIEIAARLRQGRWKAALVPLGAAALLGIVSNFADPSCEEQVDFHSEMYSFIAMDAARAGDTSHAKSLHQKAVEVGPDSARAHSAFADFYLGREKFDLAIEEYDAALAISEDYWVVQKRGASHFVQGDIARALADFDRSIELNPEYSAAYLARGSLYFQRGDYSRAITDVQRALETATTREDVARAQAASDWMKRTRR